MSVIGDVFGAFQEVVLIKANVQRLEGSVTKLGQDMSGLASGVAQLRDRVARLEGFIEGVRTASGVATAQPRING